MISRCCNPKHNSFKYYGARGIGVCKEWKSFDHFWRDMHDGYRADLTLDRKNTEGHYEPGNCQWATPRAQARTRRKRTGLTSQYRGVSFRKDRGRWQASVSDGVGKKIHLGFFVEEIDAAHGYDKAAKRLFGPEACLNFPENKLLTSATKLC